MEKKKNLLIKFSKEVSLNSIKNGGERRNRTFEGACRQIYSLVPLAAWVSLHSDIEIFLWSWRRDLNPRPAVYKTAALPTELLQLTRITNWKIPPFEAKVNDITLLLKLTIRLFDMKLNPL